MMALLQTNMLWGIMAIALPIAIHFWYQKKGKTISWAATRWLSEQTTLQHRGLRLHEIGLMLVRCLLVIMLALILAKPVWNWLNSDMETSHIHLVQPDRQVADNYRFELEKAIRRGDEVYWIGASQQRITDLSASPPSNSNVADLQQAINDLAGAGRKFSFYLREDVDLGRIYVPGDFQICSARPSSLAGKIPYLDLGDGKRLFADPVTGHLQVANQDSHDAFMPEPVHRGEIPVLVQHGNAGAERTAKAALEALKEVYSIPFVIDTVRIPGKRYEWSPRFFRLHDDESAEEVERLGESFVDHFRLKNKKAPLSESQLNALFEKAPRTDYEGVLRAQQWLLIVFILLWMLERWMALRKTAGLNHG